MCKYEKPVSGQCPDLPRSRSALDKAARHPNYCTIGPGVSQRRCWGLGNNYLPTTSLSRVVSRGWHSLLSISGDRPFDALYFLPLASFLGLRKPRTLWLGCPDLPWRSQWSGWVGRHDLSFSNCGASSSDLSPCPSWSWCWPRDPALFMWGKDKCGVFMFKPLTLFIGKRLHL